MKSVEQLTNLLNKEEELVETHRKKAADLRKQIELYRCDIAQKKLNSLNLSGSEYDKVMSLLSSGKSSVLAAAEIVLADKSKSERRDDDIETES
ncbi:MAG: hypothetical protein NC409_04075 [Clostridium sp.]|nr:hypothetical protein [Clostridium sp.]